MDDSVRKRTTKVTKEERRGEKEEDKKRCIDEVNWCDRPGDGSPKKDRSH